jgi:deoxyribose-phosphate aldolase
MNINSLADLAGSIDHTLLKPEAGPDAIDRLCAEARECGFAAVCVNPYWVARAAGELAGSPVAVASVCGFPLGATSTESKRCEAVRAVEDGATEVDMVLNLGLAHAGRWKEAEEDMAVVVAAARAGGASVKVILECGLLDDDQKEEAALRAVAAGAAFVKTSTGFLAGGATVHDVGLLARTVAGRARVKASGGIRSLGQARAMLAAGAGRLGTSSGVAIIEEAHRLLDREE